jgi:ABC-2 type transport system ATP-binding protein
MPERMEENRPFIDVARVSMRFGDVEAVRDVSFGVARGQVFGLVGSDGAGKSTLLRLMATMMKPVAGTIRIDGLDVATHRREVKRLIGYMPQRFGLYQDLTVAENFDFFLDIFGIRGAERRRRKERYLGFSNLLPFLSRPAGKLSGGMKQKLGLACVLVHEPQLLILDEPTNGVDPVSRQEFWDILGDMRRGGMTICVSTSYPDEGERCDLLGVMHRAVLLEAAPPGTIRSSFPTLEEALIARMGEVDEELVHGAFRL